MKAKKIEKKAKEVVAKNAATFFSANRSHAMDCLKQALEENKKQSKGKSNSQWMNDIVQDANNELKKRGLANKRSAEIRERFQELLSQN